MATGWGWLKQFMPRGIYARAALILFLPVMTVSSVVTIAFLQRHFEDVTRQMTAQISKELAFVVRQVESAPDATLGAIAGQQIAAPLELTLRMPPHGKPEGGRVFYDFSGRVVENVLHEELPQLVAVDLHDLKQVDLAFEGQFGAYEISFPRSRVSPSNPHQLLVLLALTAALMTAVAAIFLRNQLRPIRRLARAAEDYGRGRITPYRPSGATEIRKAGTAFLDMRARIERLNEQRRLMLSSISHDLRTPLTRLQLGLSMLSPDTPPDEDDLDDLRRDVAEMSRMLSAFLDFARDSAQDYPVETVALPRFFEQIVLDAERAGLALTMIGPALPEDAEMRLRPDLMRRAVDNLITNAVRYGQEARIHIELTDRSLRIQVDDDGPGIPDELIPEALRPFARLDPARNQDRGQGVGLGLPIAAEIARAHGGQLRLGPVRQPDQPGPRGLRAEIVLPR